MTYRLVGFMTFVLLICLASFALLMNSYQAEVMEGVTHTISDVGKATLKSFEFSPHLSEEDLAAHATGKQHNTFTVTHDSEDSFVFDVEASSGAPPSGSPDSGKGVYMAHRMSQIVDSESDGAPIKMVMISRSRGQTPLPVPEQIDEKGARPLGLVELLGSNVDCVTTPEEDAATQTYACRGEEGEAQVQVYINLEEVRAEADPTGGALLRIPAWHPRQTWVTSGSATADVNIQGGKDSDQPPLHQVTTQKDIVLPIATHEFENRFAAFQQKTLLLFLGVFLVGTVFSASLAARFTRPMRKLDAGIRRLTQGDLDVEVEAEGNDEIGRLARAFNEMTSRLRASRDRERDLTRQEKLSALGRLAAGVAHDVRNPLHSIGLTLQHLQEMARPEETSRRQEFERSLGIIREEIHRLDRLVGNFLRFARSDRQTRVAVDLAQLLRETAQLVEKEAERRGIRVEVITEGPIRPFPADPESIRSSILNLVLNSFEAMTDGGTLTLTAKAKREEVLLEVADTGRGIPEEDQENVFDFAYTTREEGHGLGLAMVHQVVVEDHGGRVSLESQPDQGTRVKLVFPIKTTDEEENE